MGLCRPQISNRIGCDKENIKNTCSKNEQVYKIFYFFLLEAIAYIAIPSPKRIETAKNIAGTDDF